MITIIKKLYLIGLISFLLTIPLVYPAQGYDFQEDSGLKNTGGAAGYETNIDNPERLIEESMGRNINLILSLIGIIFIVLMLYGGITWMTASGSEEKAKKAKNIIIDSVIGLIVVVIAYAISYFVFEFVFKVTMENPDPSGIFNDE